MVVPFQQATLEIEVPREKARGLKEVQEPIGVFQRRVDAFPRPCKKDAFVLRHGGFGSKMAAKEVDGVDESRMRSLAWIRRIDCLKETVGVDFKHALATMLHEDV